MLRFLQFLLNKNELNNFRNNKISTIKVNNIQNYKKNKTTKIITLTENVRISLINHIIELLHCFSTAMNN